MITDHLSSHHQNGIFSTYSSVAAQHLSIFINISIGSNNKKTTKSTNPITGEALYWADNGPVEHVWDNAAIFLLALVLWRGECGHCCEKADRGREIWEYSTACLTQESARIVLGYCYLANLFIFTVLILGTTPSHNGDELAGTKQSLIPFLCAGFRLGQPEAALGGLLDILGMCPSMGTGLCGLVVFGIWISGKQSARKKKRPRFRDS